MAKFKAHGAAIFQLPEGGTMGFCVATCDNGCDDIKADEYNASIIVRCLNQDDDLRDLATWLLKQKTLHLNKERVALLKGILS